MNGSFALVDKAELAPHACFRCGGSDGPFVDLKALRMPHADGRLYLCTHCTLNVVLACEVVPLAEHRNVVAQLDQQINLTANANQRASAAHSQGKELARQLQVANDAEASARSTLFFVEQQLAELKAGSPAAAREQLATEILASTTAAEPVPLEAEATEPVVTITKPKRKGRRNA